MQGNGENFVFLVLHWWRFPLASYLVVQKFDARNILATNISALVLHRWPLVRKMPTNMYIKKQLSQEIFAKLCAHCPRM